MLYEYSLNNCLSTEQIEGMIIQSKILKRNSTILFVSLFTIFMGILIAIGVIIDNSILTVGWKILTLTYLIGIVILLVRRNYSLKKLSKNINKIRNKIQVIEIKDNEYNYACDNFKINLNNKNLIIESIKFKEYTLIIEVPKLLKYIAILNPIIIPNNVFGSEKMYNEFINSISNDKKRLSH